MCYRWQLLERDDYVEPQGISEYYRDMISELQVTLTPGMKTIYDVRLGDYFLGQVRTKESAGQYYRRSQNDKFIKVCSEWSSNDPAHAEALLALIGDIITPASLKKR